VQAVSRSYVLVGALLAMTGAIAVTPFTSRPASAPVVSAEARLVDADASVLNIPLNLFYDIVNIPANEVQGLDTAADSLFFNDNIFVTSAANIFGVDPGDPGHVAAIDSLIAPFPALDGGLGGLDYQLTGLLASELPISASCAVTTCYPIVPPDVITGITESTATSGSAMRCSALISGCFATFLRLPLPVRTVCCPGTPSTRPLTAASTP
jgi:hypothetical protein